MKALLIPKVNLKVLIVGLFLLLFSSPGPAHALGPWYVAPGGNDGNDCLIPVTPCATINAAIAMASDGNTIYVAVGRYTGNEGEEAAVVIDKSLIVSGGWDAAFSGQNGLSIIDGQDFQRGVAVNENVTVTMERFQIQNGLAMDGSEGGGLTNGGLLTLTDSVVKDNEARDMGGGIVNKKTMTLIRSAVLNNQVKHYSGGGGGIFNYGEISTYVARMMIIDSTINGNVVSGGNSKGGGIANLGAMHITNSTISGNVAGYSAGGIWNNNELHLNNVTITDNFAENYAGGISVYDKVIMRNTILAGNRAHLTPVSPDCIQFSAETHPIKSGGYNLFGKTDDCRFQYGPGDLKNANPMLDTLVGLPGYHAPLAGSPAIDAGNFEGCKDHKGNILVSDQRGYPRSVRCDIGAVEYQPIEASGKAASLSLAAPGDKVGYRINLKTSGGIGYEAVTLVDALPTEITFVDGSLEATSGEYYYQDGVVHWSGAVQPDVAVSVTYDASVNRDAALGVRVTNFAIISAQGLSFIKADTFFITQRPCEYKKYPDNPVLDVGPSGSFDAQAVWEPAVLKDGDVYKMWYTGFDGNKSRIGYAFSPDGIHWTKYPGNPVLKPGAGGAWDSSGVFAPSVVLNSGMYEMWYTGINQDADIALGYATSPDGLIWSRYSNPFFGGDDFQNPAMVKIDENYYLWFTYDDGFAARIYHAATAPGYWLYLRGLSLDVGEPGQWDWLNVYAPSVIRVGEEFHLYYSGQTLPPAYQIGYAISQDGFEWDRQGVVIPEGKPGKFDAQSADYPSVLKDGNTFKVWYSGADENGKYTIGYAAGKACSPGGPSTDSQQVFVPVIQKSPGCQTPFYKDDFSDAQSGWPVLDDADLTLAYDEGEYQFLIKNPYQGWGVTPGAKVANFTTSVTARRLSGRYASYGIRFGINKDWSQFYDVIVSDQYFSIWRYSGSWTTLQDWTYSSAIAAGTNANRIKVIRNGWNIILFINGQYLAGISDGTLQGLRRVGLIAASADASEEFRFDDFSLYPASCGPEANLALQEQGLFEMSNPEVHSSPLPPALKP